MMASYMMASYMMTSYVMAMTGLITSPVRNMTSPWAIVSYIVYRALTGNINIRFWQVLHINHILWFIHITMWRKTGWCYIRRPVKKNK
jgi:hypothetical protein